MKKQILLVLVVLSTLVCKATAAATVIEATATDDIAILYITNRLPSVRDKTWELNVTTGTVKTNITKADVTLSGLPAGLDYTVAKGTGNTIVITLTGVATTALTADATITATINGSAVTEAGTQNSAGISLHLWYVGEATTFVLTNEGGLIDKLIAAGHGDDNLYEVLEFLQPNFSSVITERFMKTMVSSPQGSEIFTATLSPFSGLNNPVGINADGTLMIASIYGRDYYGKTSYTTTESNLNGVGTVSFTTADDVANLIDTGERIIAMEVVRNYKVFAIAWMPAILIEATATDDIAILHINNKAPSARDKTWELSVTSGTVKANIAKADVSLTGLPAGLDYTVAKGAGNTIVITLTGAATTALTADMVVTATINGSAVTEAGAQNSTGISLNLWYVGEATSFVLTNEGGLIDKLIAAGHGNKNLYQIMELLQPVSGGVITDRFMKTLASCPEGSEIFIATLSNYTGINNPVGIDADGTLIITATFGRDYDGDTGYTTTTRSVEGVGDVMLTEANSAEYYINTGCSVVSEGNDMAFYMAFAIAWMPATTSVNDLTENDNVIVYPNPAKGVVWFNLPDNEIVNSIQIYDMQGKQVFYTGSIKKNQIDLSGLKNGIYLLQLETSGKIYKQKIIIE